MINIIYLDYSATTPVDPKHKELLQILMEEDFGNPSSLHKMGVKSEKYIKKSRSQISKHLNVNEKEIYFTSGGTESNNLAISGTLSRHRKGKIITSSFEHPSVLSCFEAYEKKGFEVVYVPVDLRGTLNIECLKQAIDEQTILVSIMQVNNEIGTIMPIEAIGQFIDAFNKKNRTNIVFHVDGVQGFGKIQLNLNRAFVDLYTFSGHKIHGLKGSGGLFVREGIKLTPLFYGGSQEKSLRPGTENIYGIASLGEATVVSFETLENNSKHVCLLRTRMIEYLKSALSGIEINGYEGDLERQSSYILNVSFRGIKGEILLHALEMNGVYVSTGSACSSKKKSYSNVLKSMNLDDERMDGAIRISFSKLTTVEDVDTACLLIEKAVHELRSIIKRR